MMRYALLPCLLMSLMGCADPPQDAPQPAARLEVFPAWTRAAPGVKRPVEVWLRAPDGSVEDVTARAALSGSGAAQVQDGSLVVEGVGPGALIARLDGLEGAARVEGVEGGVEGLRVRPLAVTLAPGERQRLQAFGRFGAGPEIELTGSVAWSGPGVVGAEVVAGEVGEGEAVATLGAVSAQAAVRVSAAALEGLSMERERLVLPVGTSLPVEVQGRYAGEAPRPMTAQAAWSVEDAEIAAVEGGVVRALAPGVTRVVARSGALAASMEVEVVTRAAQEVAITPGDGVMGLGEEGQFSASAIFEDGSAVYVTREGVWESSDPAVLAVGNGAALGGQVTAMGLGRATLTVRFAGALGRLEVEVVPAP